MKIAVFVGSPRPTEGGGYNYVADFLQVLDAARSASSHQFALYFFEQGQHLTECFPSGPAFNLSERMPEVLTRAEIKMSEPSPPRVQRYFHAVMLRLGVGGLHASNEEAPDPNAELASYPWVERILLRDGVQHVLLMAPWLDGMLTEIPYSLVMWDLNHRINPWFPEVGKLDLWQARETSFRNLLQRASQVICGTNEGARQICAYYGISPARTVVLPLAVPTYTKRANATQSNDEWLRSQGITGRYLFYPAQFWPHKNHVVILDALRRLKDQGRTFKLVLTGSDKGNLDHVDRVAIELGVKDDVINLSFVEQERLLDLYQNAFCLVFPTFFGPDNLPPLEAFALCCPVIASDIPGSREQLGDAALFFDPTNPDHLAEQILRLDSAETRRALCQEGQAVAQMRTWENNISTLMAEMDKFSLIRRAWR